MTAKKQSTAKGSKKGKAEGTTKKGAAVTKAEAARIEAEAEALKAKAHDYAHKAYSAALEHFYANQNSPFALSRLAVVYGEQEPGDFNMVVTLPGRERWEGVSDDDIRQWMQDAELLARTLEHPKCPDTFKTAFGAIFTDAMLDGSGVSWTTPAVMRVMFPLVMIEGWGNRPADVDKARDILILLQNEFVNEETQAEVRKPLGLQ